MRRARAALGILLGLCAVGAAVAVEGVGARLLDLPSVMAVGWFGVLVFLELRRRGAQGAALLGSLHHALWAAGLAGTAITLASGGVWFTGATAWTPAEVGPHLEVALVPMLVAGVVAEVVVGPLAEQQRRGEQGARSGGG